MDQSPFVEKFLDLGYNAILTKCGGHEAYLAMIVDPMTMSARIWARQALKAVAQSIEEAIPSESRINHQDREVRSCAKSLVSEWIHLVPDTNWTIHEA